MQRLKILLRLIYLVALWETVQEIKTTKGKIRLLVLVVSLCGYEILVLKL